MNRLPIEEIQQASRIDSLMREMNRFYDELDRRIEMHEPVCRNRGACCNFDSYGHKLFVTTLELAYFLSCHRAEMRHPAAHLEDTPQHARHRRDELSLPVAVPAQGQKCPFQRGGTCTTRRARPVGCRVFFCESHNRNWQQEISEWSLHRLREMHVRYAITYVYVEWLAALHGVTTAGVAG